MLTSLPRDNWERLVAAVVKRDQIWQLCHQDSITTVSSNTHTHSTSGSEILSIPSNRSRRISASPPLTIASASQVRKNGTWNIFSALQRRIQPKNDHLDHIPEDLQLCLAQEKRFSLDEVQFATENFRDENIIGRGAQSKIYKGRMADGSIVAVKRLTTELKEMTKELEITSIASHRNVLRARGYCITEKERLLIYPIMVNNSVASWLRERNESLSPLNWRKRKQIAIGAAKGLAYLHHECIRKIIHRDIKAANILLDDDFEAIIADFNLAEFMDCYDGHVLTPIKGTLGHIAPEYLATGKCSLKNDVFGYGVFLLELITAQRSYDLARAANNNDVMLLNMVKGSCKEQNWRSMIDAELQSEIPNIEEVVKLLKIALICTQSNAEARPTMLEVVRMLEVGYDIDGRWIEWYVNNLKYESLELGHLKRFTIHELEVATEDFSNKVVSKDGFNMIYKGRLADGTLVAVKRYSSQSLECYFEKELDIGRICVHPNVVHVIGFCHTPTERLLVLRLMINGSVESWLRGRHESRPPPTWQKRKEIALGAARGLAYLHYKCGKRIVHRNVKASNMLLDENFEVAVADFGMAKFMDWNDIFGTTSVRGTTGHIAPEYLATGECSEKSDVYGYGVFLLELVSGQSAYELIGLAKAEGMMLIDWVKRNYEERKWEVMVDKDNGDDYSVEEVVWHLVQIALLCTRYNPYQRPNMSEVMWMLGDDVGSSDDDTHGVAEELSGPR